MTKKSAQLFDILSIIGTFWFGQNYLTENWLQNLKIFYWDFYTKQKSLIRCLNWIESLLRILFYLLFIFIPALLYPNHCLNMFFYRTHCMNKEVRNNVYKLLQCVHYSCCCCCCCCCCCYSYYWMIMFLYFFFAFNSFQWNAIEWFCFQKTIFSEC